MNATNTKARRTVLITGATGSLGPRIVWAFHKAGYQLRVLSTVPATHIPSRLLPNDIDITIGDITKPETIQPAMQNVDVVLHLAALLHIANPSPSLRDQYEKVNIAGTENIAQAALQENVERVVFFSTIAVYGSSTTGVITEDTVPQPDTDYAKTKLTAEKVLLGAKRADGTNLGVILRLGAVFGSRIKGNYRQLLISLNRRRFIPIGDGSNRRTLIYDRDVAQAALLAVETSQASGQVYNVTDGDFHTVQEIISTMCDALGRKTTRFRLPIGPMRRIAGLSEDLLAILNLQAPITRATLDKYTEDIAVSGRRIQEQLRFSPRYNLTAGWHETVAEMKRSGDL